MIKGFDSDNGFVGCVELLVVLVLSTIFGGWVISVLWGWFIVPIFGLVQISVVQAIGVSLTIGLFTSAKTKVEKEDYGLLLLNDFISGILTLIIGWIVQGFL